MKKVIEVSFYKDPRPNQVVFPTLINDPIGCMLVCRQNLTKINRYIKMENIAFTLLPTKVRRHSSATA